MGRELCPILNITTAYETCLEISFILEFTAYSFTGTCKPFKFVSRTEGRLHDLEKQMPTIVLLISQKQLKYELCFVSNLP